jgi:hypothetical protein
MRDSGEEMFVLLTLPYLVGEVIITTQEIVCQEKNTILENFGKIFVWKHGKRRQPSDNAFNRSSQRVTETKATVSTLHK